MKIAITAKGEGLDAQVDERFGRAQGFAIVETETGTCEYVDNRQNVEAVQGAGTQAAQTVVGQGVETLLTGHCGPNAFRALQAAGIKIIVGVTGTVGEVGDRFKAGELKEADAADVGGHW